jgi:hypothetical protein
MDIKSMENIVNAILVNEDVRSAMLIQPSDYGEFKGTEPKTLKYINEIKKNFPKLKYSDNYESYQGTIISKKSYDHQTIDLNKMGEILGYPCYKEFGNIDKDNIYYGLSLKVKYNSNTEGINIFNNVCKDKTYIDEFKNIADKAFTALTKDKYKKILEHFKIFKVNNVYIDIQETKPILYLINKLKTKHKISNEEDYEIINAIYNLGYNDLSDYAFDYTNPTHRAIAICLLLNNKYDILGNLYPLKDYPQQNEEYEKINSNLENRLIEILDDTKLSKPHELTSYEIETLQKSLEELEFSEKLSKYSFEYKNLYHRGIILYLLSIFVNNILSPFKSLDDYIRMKTDMDDTRSELEETLIEILDETKETFK